MTELGAVVFILNVYRFHRNTLNADTRLSICISLSIHFILTNTIRMESVATDGVENNCDFLAKFVRINFYTICQEEKEKNLTGFCNT